MKNVLNLLTFICSGICFSQVGVGTPSPETQFDIRTTTDSYGLQHSNGTIKLRTYLGKGGSNGGTDGGWFGTQTNHPLDLMTNSVAKMRITEDGKVGIGTSAPTQKLDINGKARIADLPNASLTDRAVYADASGVLKVSTASTVNRVIWGVVRPNSNGTVTILNSGSGGWTATRNGIGTVIITATTPFNTPPAANAIQYLKDPINQITNTTFPKASAQDNAGVDNVSRNQIQIWACDSNFNRSDRVISFSATGY